jgi:hypothetical protein
MRRRDGPAVSPERPQAAREITSGPRVHLTKMSGLGGVGMRSPMKQPVFCQAMEIR